jgi:hypothetical protein
LGQQRIPANGAEKIHITAGGKLRGAVQKRQHEGSGSQPVLTQIHRGQQPGFLKPLHQQGGKHGFGGVAGLKLLQRLFHRFLNPAGIDVKMAQDQGYIGLGVLQQLGKHVFQRNFVMGAGDAQSGGCFQTAGAIRIQTAQK